jgi:glycosyltransferase involved in cell wall biosynthesis
MVFDLRFLIFDFQSREGKMRIGLLGPIAWRTPPEHYGGWELVVSNLAEGLVRRGHEVTLFATADSLTGAHLEAVCPRPLTQDSSLYPRVYETLHAAHAFEMARSGHFELLHNNTGCFPMVFSRLVPIPVLTTLHGSAAEADSRIIYREYKAQPYVSISQAEREIAPELNYVATVYNGIEVDKFAFSRARGSYLLVVGRMSPDKGVHLAIEVAEQFGMPLILAGIVPPENQAYFESHIAPRLKKGRVEFIGPANHALKSELYAGAYAFLHLITYREAFGLTMAEAMACGTPVIGIGLGSVPELVKPGISGFIIPPSGREAEIIAGAVAALSKVDKLERAAIREYVSGSFGVEKMIDGYEQVYRQLLAGKNQQ